MNETCPTLRRWYDENRRPEMTWRLSPTTLAEFDKAIKSFERFAGADVRVNEVDESKLAAFVELRELGPRGKPTARYRRKLARCVRRIVRDFDPALLAASRDPQRTEGDEASHLTLQGYFDQVYLRTALADSSDAHRTNAQSKVRQFDEFHGGDVLLSELADPMLEGFLASVVANKRSVGTANQYRAIICAVWRHAYRVGFACKPPRVKRLNDPRREEKRPVANSGTDRSMILKFPSLRRES